MFSKILIANRGEIASRIMRTARRMGIRCVAVYSDADRHARFVREADEAWYLGGAAPEASYLNGDRIIDIALKSGAQAIHPGYGFLSENAQFAEKCEKNGLVFIGPPVAAIELMGSKSAAKFIMEEANVPLVPGYHGGQQDNKALQHEAERIGYPLIIKASAGGGGKGMRIVTQASQLEEALGAARREAASAFGSDKLLLEKYIQNPRHVEIQVFCDQHGNGVFLFERDCSVQRRHQKVIEEAPAPGLSERLRAAMGEAALNCARAIKYVGAGTVEFLLDQQDQFYFMERNTRLQVEHPVTEMITGQDLVEWQLRVANGEPLPLQQDQIKLRGHALEARIYAEDPDHDFLPATGTLRYLRTPDENAHVRVDTGVVEGDEVSIHYDPMIAKLIVWDDSRERAINRMVQALEEYRIGGVKTNIRFLHALADSAPFRNEELDTGFIGKHEALLFPPARLDENLGLVLSACFFLLRNKAEQTLPADPFSPFARQNSWRLNSRYARPMTLLSDDVQHNLSILEQDDHYEIRIGDSCYDVRASLDDDRLQATVNGHRFSICGDLHQDQLVLFHEGETFHCALHREQFGLEDQASEGGLQAPMNGSVVAVMVKAGDRVKAGQTLVIMEAMKMEHAIKAPADGSVSEVFFAEGDLVSEGAELIALELDSEEAA